MGICICIGNRIIHPPNYHLPLPYEIMRVLANPTRMSFTPPTLTRTHLIITGIVCAVVLVALFVVSSLSRMSGVGQSASMVTYSPRSDGIVYTDVQDEAPYMERNADTKSLDMTGTIAPVPSPLPPDTAPIEGARKIIRTASLSILVKDTDTAADGVRAVAQTYGGERGNENFSQYAQGVRSGTITIWVPSEHFDEAVRDIKTLALRVNNEAISTQDVSAQHVDLTARLTNLRATEAQYQELMARSGSIEDILNVTKQLSQTRQEIEVLQAQLDRLTGQIALSSITVSITPESPVVSPGQAMGEWRPGTVAREAYHELLTRLMGVGDGLIMFVIVGLPLLVIAGIKLAVLLGILWLLYRLGRALYRKATGVEPSAL